MEIPAIGAIFRGADRPTLFGENGMIRIKVSELRNDLMHFNSRAACACVATALALIAIDVAMVRGDLTCAICSSGYNPGCGPACQFNSSFCCTPSSGCQGDKWVCAYMWQNYPVKSCYYVTNGGNDCVEGGQVTCSIGAPMTVCGSSSCVIPSKICSSITLTITGCTGNRVNTNCKGS